MRNTPKLDESFEVSGQWWLPDSTEKVQGILEYSPTQIELTLKGGFSAVSLADTGIVKKDFDRIKTIHGFADGQNFTLQDVIVIGRNVHSKYGLTETKCTANFIFVGRHFQGHMKIWSFAIACHYLNEFLNTQVIDIQSETDTDGLNVVKGECRESKPERFRLDSIKAQLEFRSHPNFSQNLTSAILQTESYILVRFDDPQTFDTCFKASWRVCQLLTLLTDQFVKPEWMEVTLESGEEIVGVLWKAIRQRDNSSQWPDILVRLDHCNDFQLVLNTWFSATETFMNAVYMFLAARTSEDAGSNRLEPRFLMASQAFEAFSRATTQSAYMNQHDYDEQVVARLNSAIPPTVGSDHRSSLKSRIRFGNEYSLRKRLSNALNDLDPVLQRHVFKDKGRFANGIVDTRNFLTHYGDDLRQKVLSGENLWWATEKLVMFVRILLLHHLGIDNAHIKSAVEFHNSLKQHPRLWSDVEDCRP